MSALGKIRRRVRDALPPALGYCLTLRANPLLGLAFLMLLINIAGLLLCFVGLLFTYPMTAVVFAYTYRALSGQPIAPAR